MLRINLALKIINIAIILTLKWIKAKKASCLLWPLTLQTNKTFIRQMLTLLVLQLLHLELIITKLLLRNVYPFLDTTTKFMRSHAFLASSKMHLQKLSNFYAKNLWYCDLTWPSVMAYNSKSIKNRRESYFLVQNVGWEVKSMDS